MRMSGDDRGASSTNKGSCTSNKNNISNEKGWTTTSSSKPITEDKPIGSLMLVASCGRNASINIFHNEPPSATINALSTFKEQTAPSSLDSLGYTDRSDVPIRDKLVLTRSDTKPNPTEENAENDVRSHLCYRDDQWSPANTDGKKVYPRDFLLALSKDTLSLKKPDNLPKEIRRNDDKAEQVYDITIFSMEARAGPDFSPSFNSNSYSNKSPLQLGVRSQQAICQPQPAQYLQMPLSTHHMTYIKSSPMPVQYNSNSRPPNYVTSGYPMIIPQLQGYSYQQPSQAHPQSYFFNPPTQLISRTQPSPAPNMVDGSPAPSGESSARQTPQPSQPNPNKEFQAAFAKHVAFAKLVAQAQVQAAPQNPTQPSPTSNMVMQQPVLPHNTVAKNKRRSNAIPIIDINTGRDRLNEMYEQEQDGSPPPSGESSARQTPQPSQPNPNKEFQYKFQDKLNSKPPTGDKPFASSSKFISWGGIPCIKEADLYRNHCGVSNKVAPQKFDILLDQIRNLHINDPQRLQEIVDLVYEKAIDEPNFSPAYALLCRELAFMKVPLNIEADKGKEDAAETVSKKEGSAEYVIFRKLLITRCQMEFEKKSMDESVSNPKVELIESCLDAEKKKEMPQELEEYHRKLRMKSVGNIMFFGELFKQNMLTVHMMQRCVSTFLEAKDEESWECLCALLTTTGLVLESKKFNMTPVFNAIQDIVNNKSGNISSRVRFMLQDVMDLWISNWVPQGQDLNHVQPLMTNSTNMNAAIDALANELDRKNFNIRWAMKNLTIPNKTPTVTASECNATPAAPAQVNK